MNVEYLHLFITIFLSFTHSLTLILFFFALRALWIWIEYVISCHAISKYVQLYEREMDCKWDCYIVRGPLMNKKQMRCNLDSYWCYSIWLSICVEIFCLFSLYILRLLFLFPFRIVSQRTVDSLFILSMYFVCMCFSSITEPLPSSSIVFPTQQTS